ncbi:MAG: hypothetical protein LC798_12915 [Chloroflexi bacterium]|nr:hypothetical protein [Chloroflexota bacterium]
MKLEAHCPAASLLKAADGEPRVICGVMHNRFEVVDSILKGAARGVLLTMTDDPSSIQNLCCGRGLPVIDEPDVGHDSHTCCPLWRLDRQMSWAEAEAREATVSDDDAEPDDGPSLADLIHGRASLEEYGDRFAGPAPQWGPREEAVYQGRGVF